MAHLYELTSQFIGLQKLIEEDELDPQALQDTLDGLEGDIRLKAEGLLAYVANLGADVDSIDNAMKRLQARKAAIVNRQEALREYLRFNMEQAGIDKITCPLFTITLREPPPIVVIESEDLIPDMYKETIETVKVDKAAIARHLKDKIAVPGARLGDGKRGLMIR